MTALGHALRGFQKVLLSALASLGGQPARLSQPPKQENFLKARDAARLIRGSLGVCLTFGGMFLSSKITNFSGNTAGLAIVSTVSVLLSMIPSYGLLISLIATFFLLRQISKEGVILMMIVSWVMMFVILALLAKLL